MAESRGASLLATLFPRRHRPRRYHFFVLGAMVEEGIPPEWARREARCIHCGEERLVWRFVDTYPESSLNIGPCQATR